MQCNCLLLGIRSHCKKNVPNVLFCLIKQLSVFNFFFFLTFCGLIWKGKAVVRIMLICWSSLSITCAGHVQWDPAPWSKKTLTETLVPKSCWPFFFTTLTLWEFRQHLAFLFLLLLYFVCLIMWFFLQVVQLGPSGGKRRFHCSAHHAIHFKNVSTSCSIPSQSQCCLFLMLASILTV